MLRTTTILLIAVSLLLPACGGPTGKYEIDHEATLASDGPAIGNGPGGREGLVRSVRGLSIFLELKRDGSFAYSSLDAENFEVDATGNWSLVNERLSIGRISGITGPVTLRDGEVRFRLENPPVEVVLRK